MQVLELERRPEFLRREWRIQRLGWVLMLLLVLAGLLGVLGRGPLASASAALPGGALVAEYERVVRHRAPTTLTLRLGEGAAADGRVRLWLSRDYHERVEMLGVVPEPERVEAHADGYVYHSQVRAGVTGATLVLHLEPEGYGRQTVRLGLLGGDTLSLRQFVVP